MPLLLQSPQDGCCKTDTDSAVALRSIRPPEGHPIAATPLAALVRRDGPPFRDGPSYGATWGTCGWEAAAGRCNGKVEQQCCRRILAVGEALESSVGECVDLKAGPGRVPHRFLSLNPADPPLHSTYCRCCCRYYCAKVTAAAVAIGSSWCNCWWWWCCCCCASTAEATTAVAAAATVAMSCCHWQW